MIKPLLHRFSKGGFLANVLVLVGGTAFSQGLLFLASPFISRLYKPDDFGTWAIIKSLSFIFSAVACWRYELSIVLPKKDREAGNLFAGSAAIATIMSFCLLLVVSFFSNAIAQLLSGKEILPWLWVLPLTLLLTGIYQSSSCWSTRKKHFRLLAIAGITQSLVMVGIQLGLPLIKGASASGLIIGAVTGQAAATGLLVILISRSDGRLLLQSLSWTSIRDGIYKYRNFPLYVAPYGFISSFQQQIVLLLLGQFASTSIAGLYAFANSIVRLPISLVASSLNQAFFPKAAEQIESENLSEFVAKILTLLVVTTTPLFAFFLYNAEWLFTLVFGKNWAEASIYAVWLSLTAFMLLYTSWLDRIYDVLGKQKLALLMEVIYDIISIASFVVMLFWLQNPHWAVGVYSLVTATYNFIWLLVTFKIAKFQISAIGRISIFFLGCLFIFSAIHLLARHIFLSQFFIPADLIILALYYICFGLIYLGKKRRNTTWLL